MKSLVGDADYTVGGRQLITLDNYLMTTSLQNSSFTDGGSDGSDEPHGTNERRLTTRLGDINSRLEASR